MNQRKKQSPMFRLLLMASVFLVSIILTSCQFLRNQEPSAPVRFLQQPPEKGATVPTLPASPGSSGVGVQQETTATAASPCSISCRSAEVSLSTSDGETYDVGPGRGGYTYAGALAWEVVSDSAYCKGKTPQATFKISKKQAGKIIATETFTLNEGQTSPPLTHPSIKRAPFTFTVKKIMGECI